MEKSEKEKLWEEIERMMRQPIPAYAVPECGRKYSKS